MVDLGGVTSAALSLIGIDTDETYEDRLRRGYYVAPSGTRIPLIFEDLSREVNLRGTAFEFPGIDDAYVQRRGFGPRTYPWRVFFAGDQHDRQALTFEAALLEVGVGKLEHPVMGTIPRVVPFGAVKRTSTKDAVNLTVIEVTFWTTTGVVYPSQVTDAENEILSALAGFGAAIAGEFQDYTLLSNKGDSLSLLATIQQFIREVNNTLGDIADATLSVSQQFREIEATLNSGLDTFIGTPLLLADQIVSLVNAPATALTAISSRLEGYAALAASIYGAAAATPANAISAGYAIESRSRKILNDLRASDLFASAAMGGAALSTINETFGTRGAALLAADSLLTQFDTLQAWRDTSFGDVASIELNQAIIDTGESYQQLLKAVALTAGRLVEVSFSALPEHAVILDRPRTIIDLCAELYGGVDTKLDYLILTNDLSGDEILELPRGRKIVYYPAAA